MKRNRPADWLVYLLVRILICVVQAIPLATGRKLAGLMVWLFADVIKLRGKVIDENLACAFPNLAPEARRRLGREMWEHLFLLVLEVAHAPRKIHETNWREFFHLRDVAPLVRLLLSQRAAIVVTAHFGNFEMGGYSLGILGFPTYSVARRLDNPYLDRFVNRFRGATGQHIVPKTGGYDQILDVLGRAGTMAFLADQYAGDKGCWVDFFGRPASAYKAIALLSMEHDAPMAICSCRRLDQPLHFEMQVHAMADPRTARNEIASIRDLTQWYTAELEAAIRLAPGQYWWLHRRWKDTRKKRPARQAA